mmetsp:Transcript_2518/g.8950  ORF Transcript_2518/g.8950 Transcript_2518/m.8950 type:complete len:297 (-) Transcript_2518:231-1121(-)
MVGKRRNGRVAVPEDSVAPCRNAVLGTRVVVVCPGVVLEGRGEHDVCLVEGIEGLEVFDRSAQLVLLVERHQLHGSRHPAYLLVRKVDAVVEVSHPHRDVVVVDAPARRCNEAVDNLPEVLVPVQHVLLVCGEVGIQEAEAGLADLEGDADGALAVSLGAEADQGPVHLDGAHEGVEILPHEDHHPDARESVAADGAERTACLLEGGLDGALPVARLGAGGVEQHARCAEAHLLQANGNDVRVPALLEQLVNVAARDRVWREGLVHVPCHAVDKGGANHRRRVGEAVPVQLSSDVH